MIDPQAVFNASMTMFARQLSRRVVDNNILIDVLRRSGWEPAPVVPVYFWLGAEADAEPEWGDFDDD